MSKHILGEFEHLVLLAVLRLGEEAYGASVADELEERTGRDVTQAAVYLTLKRMEEKGWLSSRTGEPTARRGGRARTYYTLTDEGREKVREARAVLTSLWAGIVEELA